jgi:hypothetical protein
MRKQGWPYNRQDVVRKMTDEATTRSTTSSPPQMGQNMRLFKVYLWDDSTLPNGFREKKIYNVEGFSTHPRTRLVESPDDADIIVWVTVRGNTEAEIPPVNYSNVLLLDYAGMLSFQLIHKKCIFWLWNFSMY